MIPKYGLAIPPNLENAFQALDLNEYGYITYTNYLAATLPETLRCREDLCHTVFSLMDRNRDGYIDESDLAVTFMSNEKRNDAAFLKLCRDAMIEASGSPDKLRLDFDEFLRIVVGNQEPITAKGFEGR